MALGRNRCHHRRKEVSSPRWARPLGGENPGDSRGRLCYMASAPFLRPLDFAQDRLLAAPFGETAWRMSSGKTKPIGGPPVVQTKPISGKGIRGNALRRHYERAKQTQFAGRVRNLRTARPNSGWRHPNWQGLSFRRTTVATACGTWYDLGRSGRQCDRVGRVSPLAS
jgi:hypothetical protein